MDPVEVFGDFLRPVLEAAGFQRDGPRRTSKRGDVLLGVRASRDRIGRTLEAGVTFGPGPELFTLGPMRGEEWGVDQPVIDASVVETFRCHKAAREGKDGDCGPESRYRPDVDPDALEALLKS